MNDPRRRLDDILARCDDAARLVERGRDEFETDVILRHAAKSIIADIGEAAKNLEDLADQFPGVPWAQIARMRDRVAHRDFDYDVVWDTLSTDLPTLERAVRAFCSLPRRAGPADASPARASTGQHDQSSPATSRAFVASRICRRDAAGQAGQTAL